MTTRQDLDRHGLLPDAGDAHRVPVHVQQGPEREVDRQAGEVTTDVVVVDEESDLSPVYSLPHSQITASTVQFNIQNVSKKLDL